ncbi:MAG: DUF1934 domain-containing protein [Saccharofermentanales bacterium]
MDLNNKVSIDILTEQRSGGRSLLRIVQQTEGDLTVNDDAWLLTYTEPNDSRTTPTSARLSVNKDGTVSLERAGTDPISLLFEEGKQHISRIEMPDRMMDVGFLTNKLKLKLADNGGKISLKYTVTAQDLVPVSTTMNFTVSPKSALC